MEEQILTREFDEYLSDKRPNLSAPGYRKSDLYYSVQNSSVECLESTCDWSMKIGFPTFQFGSNNQINMPASAFIGQLVLHLELNAIQADESIARGWGLRMLRTIRFQFGTSASTPIILTAASIWHMLMGQCTTSEKRSELLKMCGESYIQSTGTTTIHAYVPIPVPFSTICEKLFYDSTILGQPITVFVEFESDPTVIYGGSATHPRLFRNAELMVRQQRLADAAKSLRNVMNSDPTIMYSYPFTMALGYTTPGTFPGSASGQKVTVQFNQFQNSDLLGIIFCVQKAADLNPSGGNSPNPFHLDDISDIEVSYNGMMVFQFPAKSYKAISTYMGDQQAAYYENSVIAAGTSNPFTPSPVNEYLVFLDFSQCRAVCMQDHMYNTWRIPPGNVLNVSFYTSENSTQYVCSYTCLYNAIVTAQAGVSNVYTS